MKQRSRSADALDLLKDGTILEETVIIGATNTGEATAAATTTANTTTSNLNFLCC